MIQRSFQILSDERFELGGLTGEEAANANSLIDDAAYDQLKRRLAGTDEADLEHLPVAKSIADQVREVEKRVEAVCSQALDTSDWENAYKPSDMMRICLAVHEALVNAVTHGSDFDPQAVTTVVCILVEVFEELRSTLQLSVIVTDPGEVFAEMDIPDCRDSENLEMPTGRGMMMMKTFMNSVVMASHGEKGKSVIMTRQWIRQRQAAIDAQAVAN